MKSAMRQIRRTQLKYRHECLHESMLTRITMFDDDVAALDAERKRAKMRVTFLELFALTLEEEMIILNDFDLLEDGYLRVMNVTTAKQNDKVSQVRFRLCGPSHSPVLTYFRAAC